MLTIGSLFSGIAGLDLGLLDALAALGVAAQVAWQAEINPYARAVLARHWPTTRRFEDVRHVDAAAPPVDALCGGSPCQDLSSQGKRAGLCGPKSGLWFEYVRCIRVLRPRLVFLENVPELAGYLGGVLGPLAELGFDAEWGVFSAAGDGAPHLRRRMFVLAHANLHRCEGWRCGGTRASVDAAARGGTLPDADGGGRGRGAGLGGEQTGRHSRRRRARLAVLGAAVVRPTAARAFLTLAARAGLTEGTAHG